MSVELSKQVITALAAFSSDTRLYALTLKGDDDLGSGGLLVEAFAADEQVQGVGVRDIIALSTNAHLDLAALLGRSASLQVSLADGSRTAFSGYINEVAMLGSEGGLARFRIRLVPWLWRLSRVRNSRVWQDKSVIEIIDAIFADYKPLAQWRWSGEVPSFMADAVRRSYCCQYREADLDFVTRLLTEEGLSWRFEEDGAHDDAQMLVIFSDSTRVGALPVDASAGAGIRYHAARAGEAQDGVQALQTHRSMTSALRSVASYDYKSKRIVAVSVPGRLAPGGKHAQALESYDTPGQYAYTNTAQAKRYAQLHMQALEARANAWQMRSTVRTLRSGTQFELTDAPLKQANTNFAVLRVFSVGVNNLPAPAKAGLAELFGAIPELLEETVRELDLPPENVARAIAQAVLSGYANCLDAITLDRPWRPLHEGANPKPTAGGSQSAIVVGPDGAATPNGADEIFCDRLGRIRIRFHWQDNQNATCWVRVAQRSAGGGMGSQFLPRIGQEVLVQFLENDIDRPIVVGALYNGQGEGGVLPTPGGRVDKEANLTVFDPSHDHAPSGQGNLAAGNSPVWHGAAAGAQRNSAAQWGMRSKEFGGTGYNQLLFDDSDNQGRIQLKSSHGASELNLGHLIHGADNHRGSLRGAGLELRTDHYGAIRAGAGLLVSSYKINHNGVQRDPAGDNAAGIALLKQAAKLGESFSAIAATHQTVAFASHQGAAKAHASVLDADAAPLKAMLTAASGMVGAASLDAARADAGAKVTTPGDDKLPHTSAAIIAVSAKAGLGMVAGQNLQFAAGETVTMMSGQDSQFSTGGQLRIHSGQAIGVLAGAVKAGENNVGLQVIAAKQTVEYQAQSDVINIQARDEINVISANAHIDWAAAKSISISTAGGANITISGGNITVQCPGKIMVHAGKKDFIGPEKLEYPLPKFPKEVCLECLLKAMKTGSIFALK
ncbi:type VI secretion system secreted protein VgrG [Oxalobacteraceae bacterium GrIS 1.11]